MVLCTYDYEVNDMRKILAFVMQKTGLLAKNDSLPGAGDSLFAGYVSGG